MASHIRAAALRKALAAVGIIAPPPAVPTYLETFSDADWRHSRLEREMADSVLHTVRWRVTVIPADRVPRRFYMRGTLPNVTNRAHQIFSEPGLVLVEPAPVQNAPEVFDRRLSLSLSTNRS